MQVFSYILSQKIASIINHDTGSYFAGFFCTFCLKIGLKIFLAWVSMLDILGLNVEVKLGIFFNTNNYSNLRNILLRYLVEGKSIASLNTLTQDASGDLISF